MRITYSDFVTIYSEIQLSPFKTSADLIIVFMKGTTRHLAMWFLESVTFSPSIRIRFIHPISWITEVTPIALITPIITIGTILIDYDTSHDVKVFETLQFHETRLLEVSTHNCG